MRSPGRVFDPDSDVAALETHGLGKRFGATWALRECDVTVPQGRVSALVGPNGAGKTTLLRLLVGLAKPSSGGALVFGALPNQDADFLSSVGYLAQDPRLYRRLSANDHLDVGAHMNRTWDSEAARERFARLKIPCERPVGTLSGGQRAQVALGLALAKRPRLLLLDEPVAALDPLARREFLASISEAVAVSEGDLTVVLSSHLVAELERVCDHLILLAAGHTQLCGDIEAIVCDHAVLVGPREGAADVVRRHRVIKATHTERQSRLVVQTGSPILEPPWEVGPIGLEEIVLSYMAGGEDDTAGTLSMVRNAS